MMCSLLLSMFVFSDCISVLMSLFSSLICLRMWSLLFCFCNVLRCLRLLIRRSMCGGRRGCKLFGVLYLGVDC